MAARRRAGAAAAAGPGLPGSRYSRYRPPHPPPPPPRPPACPGLPARRAAPSPAPGGAAPAPPPPSTPPARGAPGRAQAAVASPNPPLPPSPEPFRRPGPPGYQGHFPPAPSRREPFAPIDLLRTEAIRYWEGPPLRLPVTVHRSRSPSRRAPPGNRGLPVYPPSSFLTSASPPKASGSRARRGLRLTEGRPVPQGTHVPVSSSLPPASGNRRPRPPPRQHPSPRARAYEAAPPEAGRRRWRRNRPRSVPGPTCGGGAGRAGSGG